MEDGRGTGSGELSSKDVPADAGAHATLAAARSTLKRSPLREHFRRAWQRIRGGSLSPLRAALSVAIGLAIGVTPLYGVHLLLVLLVCLPLRLDSVVAYLAANISLPFIAPFLVFAEVEIGARALTGTWLALSLADVKAHGAAKFGSELFWGTAILSPLAALFGGVITYTVSRLLSRGRPSIASS